MPPCPVSPARARPQRQQGRRASLEAAHGWGVGWRGGGKRGKGGGVGGRTFVAIVLFSRSLLCAAPVSALARPLGLLGRRGASLRRGVDAQQCLRRRGGLPRCRRCRQAVAKFELGGGADVGAVARRRAPREDSRLIWYRYVVLSRPAGGIKPDGRRPAPVATTAYRGTNTTGVKISGS